MNIKFNSRKIKLVYWNAPNFGDMLSPYLVSKLSGEQIIYKESYYGIKFCIRRVLNLLLSGNVRKIKSVHFWWEKAILGIGSILGNGNRHSIVWGSGFINEKQTFKGGKIYAVRGRYTDNRLKEEGFKGTYVYGDPALLMPLIVTPSKIKSTDIAIIPHWSEADYFIEKYGKKYKIIDLRTKDIEKIILEITSCKKILSTSLHGIIISHAYGIPALWIQHTKLHDSNFKFYDYFSSVGIKEYEALINIDEIISSEQSYESCFTQHKELSLPCIDIKSIQNNLIAVAPFNISINL